ncbi:SMI1/KNR4 family protein [Streptosporangium sp. NPDC051022]|uniref:SMI1/KNR4 family protein n=1 Tax=Streptosporangium sp. NPDC051022 TaxID=3155752 RepID=UPI00341CCE90
MIKFRVARPVRLAVVAALLLGGAAAGVSGFAETIGRSSMSSDSLILSLCDDLDSEDTQVQRPAPEESQTAIPEEEGSAECEPGVQDDEPVAAEQLFKEIETLVPAATHVARTPDPALSARVDRAWERIEHWLGAHAVATLRKLGPPARPEDIAQWENSRRHTLPDALYASYLRHNGTEGLGTALRVSPSYGFLSLQDTYFSEEEDDPGTPTMEESPEAADPERGKRRAGLLVIGGGMWTGKELFVEPRTGRVGEWTWNGKMRYDGPMDWPSYPALLEGLAGSLENGTALRDWYPVVTSGCELRWAEEPAISSPARCAGKVRPRPVPTSTAEPTRVSTSTAEPTPDDSTQEQPPRGVCKPARRTPVVHAPDPAVTAQVDAVWRRIERWLARRAPATYRLLRGPADPRSIAKVEAAMRTRFPDDLRASLLRHDGGGSWGFGPAPFYELMSAEGIYADWKMMCGTYLGEYEELAGPWWNGDLIGFADAHDGGNLFLNTRTGETGEYFAEEGPTFEGDVAWPSYLMLLRVTARSLETGKPIRGWRPVVVKGELEWENVERPFRPGAH